MIWYDMLEMNGTSFIHVHTFMHNITPKQTKTFNKTKLINGQ